LERNAADETAFSSLRLAESLQFGGSFEDFSHGARLS
jgi:hypothetical protein